MSLQLLAAKVLKKNEICKKMDKNQKNIGILAWNLHKIAGKQRRNGILLTKRKGKIWKYQKIVVYLQSISRRCFEDARY